MKFIKLGHSSVSIQIKQKTFLIDPGVYSEVNDIDPDVILITHIHPDHIDLERYIDLLKNCSTIITNTEVAEELLKHDIKYIVLEHGQNINIDEIEVHAFGEDHAVIHPSLPKFKNTGYMIDKKIFHPGDSFVMPENIDPEILLIPIVAPWSKISETLDYMQSFNVKTYIPIHDGFLKDGGAFYRLGRMWAEKNNSNFLEVENFISYDL